MRQRVDNTQFSQAAVKPRHVVGKPEELARVGGSDLIHTIAKDKSAVKNADFGVF